MNDWVEFRHFAYLLAIADYEGFRAAAEYLHTGEPNLSVQAKRFQEMLGIRLFKRNSNGRIELTETGIAFKVIARQLLQVRDDAIAALIAIDRGKIKSLILGSASCVNRVIFNVACKIHIEILPSCFVRPVHAATPELLDNLIAGHVDAAIVTSPIEDPRLFAEEIVQERIVVCMRADHPLARKAILQCNDIRQEPVVRCNPQRNPLVHAQLTAYLEDVGIVHSDYAWASHPAEVRTLVKDGFGFALVREGTVDDPELVTRTVAGTDWSLGSSLVYRKNEYPKTIPVLAEHLKHHFARSASQQLIPDVRTITRRSQSVPKRLPKSEGKAPEQLPRLGKFGSIR
jgi:DNA-binding transcriptional LysR family regulator